MKIKKITLVHSMSIGGHQLEYLHHIYMGALENQNQNFIFLVPKRFATDSKILAWPDSSNIKIVEMKDEDVPPVGCGIFKKAWINAKTIGRYVKKYQITDVVVISMMEYLPFLPLFVNSKVNVRGIIYRIYLYEWKDESRLKRILDAAKYLLLKYCGVFEKVFILNDTSSACYLQRLFKSKKFCYLPDPVASLQSYKGQDIREELGIPQGKIMILHAGGMLHYKGTLDILKTLDCMTPEECNKFIVVFAGQKDKIQEKFDFYFEKLQRKQIPVKLVEGFIPFEKLADLFVSCDYVLIPYKVKSQSSGIVGHSAFYERPVVVVQGGVIGKMVKKWKLGFTIEEPTTSAIKRFLNTLPAYTKPKDNDYLDSHSVRSFYKTILN